MITDELITELPFRDVAEIEPLQKNDSYNDIPSKMSTNNDFLIEIDPDHNTSPNGVEKQCQNYDTSLEFNKAMHSQHNISLLHTNICSSEHKLNDFMYYVNNLNIQFSFIGISETWANKFNDHILNIHNYNHEQCIRSNKKKGGGTSLYIHNDIQYKTRLDLSLPKTQYESIFIEVEQPIFSTSRNTIVGEIYKPPSSKLKHFNKELEKLLIKIKKEKKYAILMGDYNVDTLSEMNNKSKPTQDFINIFSSYYYHKLINHPTRERNQSVTLIDNIYTNIPDCYNTCTSGVLKFFSQSDHYPIFTTRNIVKTTKPKIQRSRRNHSIKNISLFKKNIRRNWQELYDMDNINTAFTSFSNYMTSTFQKCFPIETIKINHKNKNPWINQSLRNEIKERDKLYMISKKFPTNENKTLYKKFKNTNLNNQRKAERSYYREQLELNNHDLKKSWKIIKKMIGKDDNKWTVKHIDFLIGNHYVSDNNTIANSFNNYFINIGNSLSKKIKSDVDPLIFLKPNVNPLYIPQVTSYEVEHIISSMNNSAAGYDEMPSSIMKQCVEYYIKPLTFLINMSITQGTVPNELKIAKVIPLYKGEDIQLIENYRPISILPYFSKIFEKVIFRYVIEFIEENNILYEYQFGFRKNHSTSHAIITLVERVNKALDTGKYVVGVFIDLKKAFDTIDHGILMRKLELYGIQRNILNWFKSYLSYRCQYVEYKNTISERKYIHHGVPQGSILGPLLFILYVNDFSRSSDLLF